MRKKQILGAGLIAVDHIFLAQKKGSQSRFIGSSGGGSVSNVLSMLSLLGYECSIFGVVGNDLSEYIVESEFREFNINFSNIKRRRTDGEIVRTRQYSHLIYDNGRHEYLEKCANCGSKFGRQYQISTRDLNRELTQLSRKVDAFVVDRANQATIDLAKNVKNKNGFVAFDLNFISHGNYAKRTKELLELADLVKTDKKTLNQLMKYCQANDTSQLRKEFSNVKYLFVTDSSKGVDSYFKIEDQEFSQHQDAIRNELVRDSGGAGDIFLSVILHEIINHEERFNKEEFSNMVDRAQALASLNCSLYGSRALQRFFLNNHRTPVDVTNNAEELRKEGSIRTPLDPYIGLSKFDIRPYLIDKKDVCEICGWDKKQRRHQGIFRNNNSISYNQMSEMLSGIPSVMYQGFEASLPYRKQFQGLIAKNAIFVGSGGSFSASTFGEYLYLKDRKMIAKAITPYELEGWREIPDSCCIWLISHGGLNTDILGAALHLQTLKCKSVIVITGNKNSALAELVKKNQWKMVLTDTMERNFVSTIGLLSQISTLSGLLSSEIQLAKLKEYFGYESLSKRLLEYFAESQGLVNSVSNMFVSTFEPHIVAFARGWGWPAMTDLESKIIEGGICTIEISELKNYTHGRWMNLFGKPDRLLTIYETPIDSELVSYFAQRFKRHPKIMIKTDFDEVAGAVDLMFKTLLVANFLGKLAKKNILKPRYPKQGRGLYSWEPKDRRGIWTKKENEISPDNQKKL